MSSGQAEEFYEYQDNELSVRVPSYLRDRTRRRIFEAQSKKDKMRPLFFFGIEFQDEGAAKVFRELMTRVPDFAEEEQGIIRRGRASYLADGVEKLTSYHGLGDAHFSCGYDVIFALDGHHIYATFLGQDDLRAFEELCKQIVSSVRLIEGGNEPRRVKRRRSSTGGLSRADKKRLTTALDGLPAEIAYLRRPILAIAREDQDLLGSGEGDISMLEKALNRIAKDGDVEAIANAHADMLNHSLLSLPGNDGAWAAPVAFVQGALRGRATFGYEAGGP